jgi:hypothetical protein
MPAEWQMCAVSEIKFPDKAELRGRNFRLVELHENLRHSQAATQLAIGK